MGFWVAKLGSLGRVTLNREVKGVLGHYFDCDTPPPNGCWLGFFSRAVDPALSDIDDV